MKYLFALTIVAATLAAWLFPRAFPVVVLSDRIAREEAVRRADAFVVAHGLPKGTRTAIRFQRSDSLLTFVELAGGGKDSVDALAGGSDVAPFTWSVRHFAPRDVHETRVHLAAGGRVVGFERRLAEADMRPELASGAAQDTAVAVLTRWLGERTDRWRLVASSYETRKTSGRIDRTFTFQRADRRIAGAPIRLDVVIAGNTPVSARRYVVIPDSFSRRYAGMRSANELIALVAGIGMLLIVVAAGLAMRHFSRARQLRWRGPLFVGGTIAVLVAGAALNEVPSQWFDYDTSTSPDVWQAMMIAGAAAIGALTGLVAAVTLAVAEAATRAAFPTHLDWWKLWPHRGTSEVAARVAGGYALAAVALAYVVVFYLVTRTLFGWWVPSELLDDPNLIATPAPWLAGIAMSLQAAVWEEALFRALPLSLLSLWVGERPRRGVWMAAGVVASALVFGFAHADYPSWPAYSRGVEIFLDACLWAVVFLRFGLIVTVIAHFVYNATLFGMFAASGSALSYRVTGAIVILAIAAPALAVAWRWIRQRGLTAAPDEARFAGWSAPDRDEPPVADAPVPERRRLGRRSRQVAAATAALAVLVTIAVPASAPRGPQFTATRADVERIADSVATSRRVDVARWRRLTGIQRDSTRGWTRFLRRHDREDLARALATSHVPPVWWTIRYVRTAGTVADRAEEWRVFIGPDGAPLGVRHVVPDSAPRPTPSRDDARRIARAALVQSGLDTARLFESRLEEVVRPARHDITVMYTDSAVSLPAGAAARVWVSLAGAEAVMVRRGVELPEAFERELTGRVMRDALITGVSGFLLISLLVAGALRVVRRRAPRADGPALTRRARLIAVGCLALFLVAAAANESTATLFEYDTTQSFASFLASRSLGLVASTVVFVLMFAGLWLACDAMRRRAGIPILPDGDAATGARDALLGGSALGGVFAATAALRALPGPEAGRVPATVSDQAVPILAHVLAAPSFVLGAMFTIAIPLLVIAAMSPRPRSRALLSLGLIVLLAGMVLPSMERAPDVASAAIAIGGIIALVLAVRAWGPLGLAAWITAALVVYALDGLRGALHAGNATDAWAEALGAGGALLALGMGARAGTHYRNVPGLNS